MDHLIPLLRQDGSVRANALVSSVDYERISAHRWHLGPFGYAIRGKQTTILMHREVMGLANGDPQEVDHRNRNLLDNTRENLRLVTRAQQMQNRGSVEGSSSRFRGVHWRADRQCWRAKVRLAGKDHYLGCFQEEVDAARMVDAWRLKNMTHAEPDPALEAVERVARGYE